MTWLRLTLLGATLFAFGCSTAPADAGLRNSFASQLAANQFIEIKELEKGYAKRPLRSFRFGTTGAPPPHHRQ